MESLIWVYGWNSRGLLERTGNIPPVELKELYYQKQQVPAEPVGRI
jgi:hypothetical protein